MKISVAICTYNGEDYLQQQLRSILDQSYPVTEIVICDDGSTDGTIDLSQEFEAESPGIIRIYRNETNLGSRKNFENAISLCTGDIIFLSDQDDIWAINKVEETVVFFAKHPSYYGVFTDAAIINEKNEETHESLWGCLLFNEFLKKSRNIDIFRLQLHYRNFATGACIAFRKEALELILPFKLPPRMWHDEWITLKLAERNRLYFLEKKLVKYRVHADQQTGLPSETYNDELLKIKRSIFNGEEKYPLYSYFHWKRIETGLNILRNYLNIPADFIQVAKQKKRRYFLSYLKSMPFVSRKIKMVKWRLKKQEDVSLYDIMVV